MFDVQLNEWFRHLAEVGALRKDERQAKGIRIEPGPMLKMPLKAKPKKRR